MIEITFNIGSASFLYISCTYKSLKVQLFVTSHIAGSPEAGAVPEWLLGIAGCALPFAALVDGGTGSRELLALVPAFGNVLFLLLGDLSRRRLKKCK
jgi:hypothetical protein